MIPEINPYNNWSGNGSTTTFDFDFYIEDETQLAVYHTNSDGLQALLTYGTDYSINELQNENGSYITFPLSSSSYEVLGENEIISLCLTLPISQENSFGKSSYLNLKTLEYAFDYLTRILQIMNRETARAVKVQEGSSADTDELVANVNTLVDNLSTIQAVSNNLTDINTVAESEENIDTAAENISNINTVVENISDINSVAADIENINNVVLDLTNIDTVAENSENINTVACDIANVNSAAENIAVINVVYNNESNINTVCENIEDIQNAYSNAQTAITKAEAAGTSSDNAKIWRKARIRK